MITLRKTNLRENHERFRRLLTISVFPLLGLSGCEILGDIFQAGVWGWRDFSCGRDCINRLAGFES